MGLFKSKRWNISAEQNLSSVTPRGDVCVIHSLFAHTQRCHVCRKGRIHSCFCDDIEHPLLCLPLSLFEVSPLFLPQTKWALSQAPISLRNTLALFLSRPHFLISSTFLPCCIPRFMEKKRIKSVVMRHCNEGPKISV